MNGIGPLARPLPRSSRSVRGPIVGLVLVLAVAIAGCGGTAAGAGGAGAGGGGGGGGGNYDTVIAQAQAAFGNTMVAGTVENGDTLKITLTEASGASMARLFLCANVRDALKAAGLGDSKIVIVDTAGTQLATQADCKK